MPSEIVEAEAEAEALLFEMVEVEAEAEAVHLKNKPFRSGRRSGPEVYRFCISSS